MPITTEGAFRGAFFVIPCPCEDSANPDAEIVAALIHRIKLHETGETDIRADRNAVGPETKLMFDSNFLKLQTAGSINSDSETVLAAKEALTRGELLKAAYPATRIATC